MNCPSCGTKIDADFGMISCPMCSAVFMVEIDGSIQELKAESEISPDEVSDDLSSEPIDEAAENYTHEEPAETDDYVPVSLEASEESAEEPSMEAADEPSEESGEYPETEELNEEPAADENIYSENFMDEFDKDQTVVAADPLGVVAFDQSAASSGAEGLYFYDLKISGLDSAQIRQNVIDALMDPRFDWVGDEIKKRISGGELILRNLNPVKAVLVVIRLQALDVEVEWEQKLYTDESVQDEEEGQV
jgi:hypothetical protein